MRSLYLSFFIIITSFPASAQLYYKGTLKDNRQKVYRNLIQNTINKNLSVALTDSTEEQWQDAFYAMEVLRYHTMWTDGRVQLAADQLLHRSNNFQRAAAELFYALYPGKFYNELKSLLQVSEDPKIFSMCAAYMLRSDHGTDDINFLSIKTKLQLEQHPGNAILEQLNYQLSTFGKPLQRPSVAPLLQKSFMPGQVLLFSFQRADRNYPGMVIVRDSRGNFIKDSTGNLFGVPQLARSIGNLPPYLTNGNTPEGIFRMKGYDVSRASFIGPTVNVQLTMPFEKNPGYFYDDSTLTDTTWDINAYRRLLPVTLRDYLPLYQTFYAGKAGRTEIIVHGTTVNPDYYRNQPYYPLTPTLGCLTSKEIWNEETGQRIQSDQQKLINMMIPAGGANGYAVVINIDDKKAPVTLEDVLALFKEK